ncbi:MAG TPA: ABC transporter ATP-binding protein [Spirochaetia bacterium]|nr:ABC transporter ATP-binding protein [Spirochaetaceae bacterium]HPE88127.1 ABC transporter ATP-binding protein [Spirochaetales bacterium]HRW23022.1 ABC transporter ATP-binding protein [Spirochaetia bacterium]
MDAEAVFEVAGLSFRYERRVAASCASLRVRQGESVAFVGPNGSGKTTMLKLLNGLLGPFDGSISFMGRPIAKNPELRRRSVYVHQHPVLFAGTVRDNLAYALRLKRFGAAEAETRLEDAAERFGIAALLDREAGRLSGGETQRVAVARAVAAGADVLLLDEPTSSMDAEGDAAVRSMLAGLRRSGSTLVFSAHDESLVRELADRVIRFESGRAIAGPGGETE